jgi:hypothetical protein
MGNLIYDLVNDKYLYDKQPKKKNAELVRKVELDKKQSIFNIENIFTNEGCYNLDVENRFNFSIKENLAYTSNKMQDYKNITKENIEDKKKRFKKIDKFIFLGTLLGRHIPKIAEKIDAKIYLVLEKNLEIFRLSLFTVDYKILAKNDGVIFSIMDDENSLEKKIYEYIVNLEYENYLLKFSSTNINIEDFVSKILGILSAQKPTVYDFHRTLYEYLYRSLKRVKENYNFLQFEDIKDRFNYFNNTPVLYIAAFHI